MILVALLLAQSTPAAPVPAPIGCAAQAGAIDGSGASLPVAVDGATLKNAGAIGRLRRKAKDGGVILIEGGDFSGQDFRKADLASICFRGSDLSKSNWSGVTAPGLGFIDTDLSEAQLTGAVLPGVLLRTATLAGADATGADFRGGQLDGGWKASLAGWKIDGANFSGFRFQCGVTEADGCPFDRQGISAKGADFSGASFHGFSFWGSALDNARFEGAEMGLQDLTQIEGATLPATLVLRQGKKHYSVTGPVAAAIARALTTSATEAVSAPGKPARLTGKHLFLSDSLTIAPAAASDPQWPSVVRVLLQLAPSWLMISASPGRQAQARGRSDSEDGHSCTLSSQGLAAGPNNSLIVLPPGRRGARPGVPAILTLGDIASIAPEQASAVDSVRIVQCAGAAPFGTMRRVPVDDLTFDALWSSAVGPAG
ncbi:MAG: pentapeptide repeat-containing protein [Sphingomonas sp.]|jgi:uncharacterized protein YjbI with pentapeptide repeats|uniref:pentapeptide repeat-containing protein n=1 Tax=Sphingomonas sp. TaxID=28214 RepID=UPI0035638C2B